MDNKTGGERRGESYDGVSDHVVVVVVVVVVVGRRSSSW